MIKFNGAILRAEFIGYAYISRGYDCWVLRVVFMNDNRNELYVDFKYNTEIDAYNDLDMLMKLINDRG